MRLVTKLLCILLVVGCTQVTDSRQVVLLIREFVEGTPLEGVQICEADTINCVTTDAGGNATLELLPINEKTSWTIAKEGYGSVLVGDVTDVTFASPQSRNMFTDQWLTDQSALLPTPYPYRGTGAVLVLPTPRFAGATFTLLNATGKRFYTDEEGNNSFGLDATTSHGVGGFVEVGPGEFQVEIGGTAGRCVPAEAWPGDAPDRIQVPVRDGHITYASITCPLPR